MIYIANSKGDSSLRNQLISKLKQKDTQVFIEDEQILPGEDTYTSVFNAINKADTIVLLITKESEKDNYFQKELTIVLNKLYENKKTRIIPIVFDGAKVPMLLDNFISYFVKNENDYINKLDEVITIILTKRNINDKEILKNSINYLKMERNILEKEKQYIEKQQRYRSRYQLLILMTISLVFMVTFIAANILIDKENIKNVANIIFYITGGIAVGIFLTSVLYEVKLLKNNDRIKK